MTTFCAWVPSYGVFYVVIAEIENVEGQCRPYTVKLQYPAAQKCCGSGFIESGSGYWIRIQYFKKIWIHVTVFFAFIVVTFGYFREGNSVTPLYGHDTM